MLYDYETRDDFDFFQQYLRYNHKFFNIATYTMTLNDDSSEDDGKDDKPRQLAQ